MELQHRFTVPAGIEETWQHFNDIEGVAACFPGATVTGADEESFTGTVKVKLGPIALVYNGSGTFEEKDEAGRRLVIDAKGKDKRGNGTAGAKVTATMTEASPGTTDVEVLTDLSITGKAAQFGRGGVIQDVSDKLLGQFVACLEERLSGPDPAAAAGTGTTASDAVVEAAPVAEPDPAAPEGDPVGPSSSREERGRDDALDLGAAVLPVLARAYWKPALAGVVVLAIIIWLVTRD